MRYQIILSGLGGQGVLFGTKILASAACDLDYGVLVSETHGMAQRGGNVVSHIKVFSRNEPFFSPLVRIGNADVLLAFHPEGLAMHGHFLKAGGVVICNDPNGCREGSGQLDIPYKRAYPDVMIYHVDATGTAMTLGNSMWANVVLIGYAASGGWLFADVESTRRALERISRHRAMENLRAFDAGVECAILRAVNSIKSPEGKAI